MAEETDAAIPISSIHPQYLHANSTSHTWPFSAIAELIDNAYDPDVGAKQIFIDWTKIGDFDCLTFTDNGAGMDFNKMHKMLSFGFSDKQGLEGHAAVGLYGNGFKSGSMFLGKDAIVFSVSLDCVIVGLLSQTYLARTKAKYVMVPIVIFRKDEDDKLRAMPEHRKSLKAILEHSPFQTEEEILSEFEVISKNGSNGTRIIIWNLRRTTSGHLDFDFEEDSEDIQIPYVDSTDELKRPIQRPSSVPEFEYSLRAYCSILYLKPWMQISIRGTLVKTRLVAKSLSLTVKDKYTPKFLKEPISITFGYRTKSQGQYGVMMYFKNRLIRPYVHLGCQLKPNAKGVGVIGVLECNFLKPTHNKQEFDDSEEYRKLKHNVGVKLVEYWEEIRHKKKGCKPLEETNSGDPDDNWVQCHDCLKWRKLMDGIEPESLPELWFCRMNQDRKYRSCRVPEEPEDPSEEQPYEKKFKQEKKKKKLQAKRRHPHTRSQDNEPTPSTSATPSKLRGTGQRTADTPTSLTSSSPLSSSGESPSSVSLHASFTMEAACQFSRAKRRLYTTEDQEAKCAKMDDQQDSTSEPVASRSSSDLQTFRWSPIAAALEQSSEQANTAAVQEEAVTQERSHSDNGQSVTQERSQSENGKSVKQERSHSDNGQSVTQERDHSENGQSVTQERDHSENGQSVTQERSHSENGQSVTQERSHSDNEQSVTQERDHSENGQSVTQERDHSENGQSVTQERSHSDNGQSVTQERSHSDNGQSVTQERDLRENMQSVIQERDQYKEQVKSLTLERDQFRAKVQAVTQERDQFMERLEMVTEERDQYSQQLKTVTQERDQYRTKVVQLLSSIPLESMSCCLVTIVPALDLDSLDSDIFDEIPEDFLAGGILIEHRQARECT